MKWDNEGETRPCSNDSSQVVRKPIWYMHEGENLFHEVRACEIYVTERQRVVDWFVDYTIDIIVSKADLQLHSVVHADVKYPKIWNMIIKLHAVQKRTYLQTSCDVNWQIVQPGPSGIRQSVTTSRL